MSMHALILANLVLFNSVGFATEIIKSDIPLFQTKDVLQVEIQSDFPKVNLPQKGLNPDFPDWVHINKDQLYPSQLRYVDQGKSVSLGVELSARGGYRASYCTFAPLRVTLPAKIKTELGKIDPTQGTVFEHSKRKVKMVTHCNPNAETRNPDLTSDEFVIIEYLLYQIIEASGFPHIKSRLAYVKYLDASGKPFQSGYALFLENAEDMAARYGLEEIEDAELKLPESVKVAFDFSLRLAASESDHGWEAGLSNAYTIGQRISTDPTKYNDAAFVRVPYDLAYTPQMFPYASVRDGLNDWSNEKWFLSYQSSQPHLKPEIQKQAQLMIDNADKVRAAIEAVPAPTPGSAAAKQRMSQWVDEVFLSANRYLQGQTW